MIRHEAISASAGSGKTFQLAHRYIRLLATGIPPDRIIALTFSRKAAGEIFDSIVKYLCQAASSRAQAAEVADRIERPGLSQDDFTRLLRDLLRTLHRLHIGTLDSFTVGVIRAFPLELGISGTLRMMEADGAQAKTAQQEVMARIFSDGRVSRAAQREFLEAFKQATYGQEEKGLQKNLDLFIQNYRETYQSLPDESAWGNPDRIWPRGSPWLEADVDIETTSTQLRTALQEEDFPDRVAERWNRYLEAIRNFNVNSPWSREVEYLAAKLFDDLEGLRRGNASIKIDRTTCRISPTAAALAFATLEHLMQIELRAALERTRGIFRVLNEYDKSYDQLVRRQGALTFHDAQALLTPANPYNDGAVLTRKPDPGARLYIDYRLDSRLDHWLLDEFQDTSDLQWEVIRNLIDETIQDPSGRRSFFYVGDVKQAIYSWRGGNARLFHEILDHYGECIAQRPLNTSFRSSQPIIDTVNAVFEHLPNDLMPPGTASEWTRVWKHHKCEADFVPSRGYAALLEPSCEEGEYKPTEEDRHRVVAQLIEKVDPLSRGLSTAVLVRSNESGRRIVDFLRRECSGMTVVHEGKAAIKDNPVVAVLLSLVRFAAHPGDTFSWRHLEMSPLRDHFAGNRLNRFNLAPVLLDEIENRGFRGFVRTWGAVLDRERPLDDFGRQRLGDLIEAAGEFDAEGSRDCNQFLRFIDDYRIHELAAGDAVRVMTVHQAKGLGFDMVILPDLDDRSMTDIGGQKLFIGREPETNQPLWTLMLPRRLVARNEPVLASHLQTAEEEACFDALCVLYVALTRAKQGLYIITGYPGKQSNSLDSAAFLKHQLTGDRKPVRGQWVKLGGESVTCLYEAGQGDWYEQAPRIAKPAGPVESKTIPLGYADRPSFRSRLERISPSTVCTGTTPADQLFSEQYYRSRKVGTAIHELFRKVGWIEEVDIDDVIRQWQRETGIDPELQKEALDRFRHAIVCPDIVRALSRPEGKCTLWRERPFEVIIDDRWVSGTFDRVAIVRQSDEMTTGARIIDYKTDEISEPGTMDKLIERYRPQLQLYRQALCRILGLEETDIRMELVFTEGGVVRRLD